MQTLTVEIPDDLARRLEPYRDEVARILEAGLEAVEDTSLTPAETPRERGKRILTDAGLARPLHERIIQKYVANLEAHVRSTPIEVDGPPASDFIIKEREPKE